MGDKKQSNPKRDVPSAEIPIQIYFWKDIGSFYCYRDAKILKKDWSDPVWFSKYWIYSTADVQVFYDSVWKDTFSTKEISLIFCVEAVVETIYRKMTAERNWKSLQGTITNKWPRDKILAGDIIVINDLHYYVITQPCEGSPYGLLKISET